MTKYLITGKVRSMEIAILPIVGTFRFGVINLTNGTVISYGHPSKESVFECLDHAVSDGTILTYTEVKEW